MAVRRAARLLQASYKFATTPSRNDTCLGAVCSPLVGTPEATVRRAWLSQAALQHAPASHTYTITITTGNLRGAGSLAPAWLQLVGTHGKSERVIVGESEDDRLARGSVRTVAINAPEDLGQVRYVNVQRLGSSISDSGTGWFLEHVVVHTPERQRLYFPCHAWFGEADYGGRRGPMERDLRPVDPKDDAAAQPVRVRASGLAVPHPDKVKQDGAKGVNRQGFGHGGEDAYFYCANPSNTVFALGVADGVYMWRESGIDSGDFSRALMRLSARAVAGGEMDAATVMREAAEGVEAAGVLGSSTICLVIIHQDTGQLLAANLGDSGCLLLRPAEEPRLPLSGPGGSAASPLSYTVKFRTNQLEHDFGRPYQLGHHAHADSAEKADVATQSVRSGDVIVLGTDGLYDNLSDVEIAEEVAAARAARLGPNAIAQRLARAAFTAAYEKGRSTPYSASASEHFDMVYSGGKPDDITVLCAICE